MSANSTNSRLLIKMLLSVILLFLYLLFHKLISERTVFGDKRKGVSNEWFDIPVLFKDDAFTIATVIKNVRKGQKLSLVFGLLSFIQFPSLHSTGNWLFAIVKYQHAFNLNYANHVSSIIWTFIFICCKVNLSSACIHDSKLSL